MDVKEIQKRFESLVAEQSSLESKKIQLETRISVAQTSLAEQFLKLKEEFGVNTLEEAQELVGNFSQQIEQKITECESLLASKE